jgi:hypothetical protein
MMAMDREREEGVQREDALDHRDEALVAGMRQVYRAPERSAARSAAFDTRLEEKLKARRGGIPWLGGLLTAAAAVALVLFVLSGSETPSPDPTTIDAQQLANREIQPEITGPESDPEVALGELRVEGQAHGPASAVEEALVALSYGYDYADNDDTGDTEDETRLDESLPNDYVAIESLFLGG